MPTYLNKPGKYNARVIDDPQNGFFESSEKKTPGIRVMLEVVDEGEQYGEIIAWTGWLSESADPNKKPSFEITVMALAKAFDFDGDFDKLIKNRFASLIDKPCHIEVEHKPDRKDPKKMRCEVKWLNPPGGGGGNAPVLAPDAATSLAARLSRRAQAMLNASSSGSGSGTKQAY